MFKRICFTIGIGSLIPLGFWIGGFNFDERGGNAVLCYLTTLFSFMWIYFYPGWEK